MFLISYTKRVENFSADRVSAQLDSMTRARIHTEARLVRTRPILSEAQISGLRRPYCTTVLDSISADANEAIPTNRREVVSLPTTRRT